MVAVWKRTTAALLAAAAVAGVGTSMLMAGLPPQELAHPAAREVMVAGAGSQVLSLALTAGVSDRREQAILAMSDWMRVSTEESLRDQQQAQDDAWRAAVDVAMSLGLVSGEPARPLVQGPSDWNGHSAGLAYALAFLNSAPLNPQPGSVTAGGPLAATGVLSNHPFSGEVTPVAGVGAKSRAALEAGARRMLVPLDPAGFPQDADVVEGLPAFGVATVRDALEWACANGGEGLMCERVLRQAVSVGRSS